VATIAAASGAAAPWLAPLVTVLGVLALGFILMVSLRERIARRGPARSPRQQIDQIKARERRMPEGHAATAQMYDTAQRLAAQLDNKSQRLELLIAEADERIARMEAAAVRPIVGAGTNAEPVPTSIAGRATEDGSTDALRRSIYALADRGLDPPGIARQLDEQVGKVELILALRPERLAAEG